jgi:hypothetical protein
MWYLIIECPVRTHPPEGSAVGAAPTEDLFLDFDPILPGWPPPPPLPPGECAALRGEPIAGDIALARRLPRAMTPAVRAGLPVSTRMVAVES